MDQVVTNQPNDTLLMTLLDITGLQPLYARASSSPHHLTLVSATVFIGQRRWPLPPRELGSAIWWAVAKTGLDPDAITVAMLPSIIEMEDPPLTQVPRLRRLCAQCGVEQGHHEGMRLGFGMGGEAHEFEPRPQDTPRFGLLDRTPDTGDYPDHQDGDGL
jgi:hypothetical protein